MEQRICKMIITSPGGTASKGSEMFRLSIPTSWAKEMGVSKESREVLLSFEDGKIIVERIKE